MALKIEDYAVIGDCQTVALVGNDGSLDWLCLPRFDSAACFASLLGNSENGRWKIAPKNGVKSVRRRYQDDTLILETEFHTDAGDVALIDFMPIRTREPDLVRIVEGRSGQVPMELELTIRFDYGSIVPWVRRTKDGIRATAGPDTLYCRSPISLHGQNAHTVAEFTVSQGQQFAFELTWAPTHEPEPRERDWKESYLQTHCWWQDWSSRCTYEGEWRDPVLRSLITLKSLTYAPTGGIVAAATTSFLSISEGYGIGTTVTAGFAMRRSPFMH